jgi:hypothetical protein
MANGRLFSELSDQELQNLTQKLLNKGAEVGQSKAASAPSIEDIAKSQLAEKAPKVAPEDPFAKLNRDLPKGGRQMKIAEPLGKTPLPGKLTTGGKVGVALGNAAGAVLQPKIVGRGIGAGAMFFPSTEIGEEASMVPNSDIDLPQEMKPNLSSQNRKPVESGGGYSTNDMLPLKASKKAKDANLKKGFEAQGKKHFGKGFSVDVPVDYTDEETGEHEKYILNMNSKNKLSDKQQMQTAGNDAILGRTGGKIKLPPKSSKSNKMILTEE